MNESGVRGKTNLQPFASTSAFCANILSARLLFGVLTANGVAQQSFGSSRSFFRLHLCFKFESFFAEFAPDSGGGWAVKLTVPRGDFSPIELPIELPRLN